MNLIDELKKLSEADRKQVELDIHKTFASEEGQRVMRALDVMVIGHVDALGSQVGALRETNAQRSLITQIKLLASENDQRKVPRRSNGSTKRSTS